MCGKREGEKGGERERGSVELQKNVESHNANIENKKNINKNGGLHSFIN